MTAPDDGALTPEQEREWSRYAKDAQGRVIDAKPRSKTRTDADVNNVFDLDQRRREAELDGIMRQAGTRRTYGVVLACVRLMYGHRLAYNEMAEAEELDGRKFRDADYGRFAEEIEGKRGLAASNETLRMAVCQLCDERRYHPVRQYLERLPVWDERPRWRLIPSAVFGHPARETDAPDLDATMLERFAVAAVARAMDPGCQVDTVLILQGEQGFKKTTFFRVLAGAWHGEGAMDIHNNKAPLLLSASWIWVWDELTTIMRGREETSVKDFVTRMKDVLVRPYGRHAIDKLRSCVIAGTTNAREILTDPTGDRRYWIVRVLKRIDRTWLDEHRDQLWAEALHLYRAKTQWHMTDEEEDTRREEAAEWRAPEAWLEPISHWVDGSEARGVIVRRGWLTMNDIAAALGVPVERRDRSVATRIGLAMGQLDWEERRRKIGRAKVTEYRPRGTT